MLPFKASSAFLLLLPGSFIGACNVFKLGKFSNEVISFFIQSMHINTYQLLSIPTCFIILVTNPIGIFFFTVDRIGIDLLPLL